jgi:hypothetical protein
MSRRSSPRSDDALPLDHVNGGGVLSVPQNFLAGYWYGRDRDAARAALGDAYDPDGWAASAGVGLGDYHSGAWKGAVLGSFANDYGEPVSWQESAGRAVGQVGSWVGTGLLAAAPFPGAQIPAGLVIARDTAAAGGYHLTDGLMKSDYVRAGVGAFEVAIGAATGPIVPVAKSAAELGASLLSKATPWFREGAVDLARSANGPTAAIDYAAATSRSTADALKDEAASAYAHAPPVANAIWGTPAETIMEMRGAFPSKMADGAWQEVSGAQPGERIAELVARGELGPIEQLGPHERRIVEIAEGLEAHKEGWVIGVGERLGSAPASEGGEFADILLNDGQAVMIPAPGFGAGGPGGAIARAETARMAGWESSIFAVERPAGMDLRAYHDWSDSLFNNRGGIPIATSSPVGPDLVEVLGARMGAPSFELPLVEALPSATSAVAQPLFPVEQLLLGVGGAEAAGTEAGGDFLKHLDDLTPSASDGPRAENEPSAAVVDDFAPQRASAIVGDESFVAADALDATPEPTPDVQRFAMDQPTDEPFDGTGTDLV